MESLPGCPTTRHGKGSYSYLVQRDGKVFLLKQIHHEPCDHCTFDNKTVAEQANLNIDYFPTNFVVCGDRLWYVDYACNPYDPMWNFEN